HLNDKQFETDRADVIRQCKKAGIAQIMEIADSPNDWDKAIDLSRSHSELIHCSLGLHPYYADQWKDTLAPDLLNKAQLKEVLAIGEIGLDYAKCTVPKEVQHASFIRMLDLADHCRLPVVIHCREAYADMMAILKTRYGSRGEQRFHGVLHCFSGSKED